MMVLCCLLACLPAEAGDTVSVRVGFYEDGDYMSRNAEGYYSGFTIEIFQELANFGGMHYEMVDTVNWATSMKLLREGRIDMLASIFRTKAREREMLFSNLPLCTTYITLNVRTDDDRYAYEDFKSFQNMRVGFIEGTRDGELFQEYCDKHGIRTHLIPYLDKQHAFAALADGTLDGVSSLAIGRSNMFRTVARFSPDLLYIAVNKDRPDLLARLDAAMNTVFLRDPDYFTQLYSTYFSTSTAERPVFSKSENAFLKEGKVIRVAYDPSWAPLEYTDPKTGAFSGVTAGLMESFAEDTGLRLRYEAMPQTKALEELQAGRIDVVCSVTGDYMWDARNNMHSTRSYLRSPTMLVQSMPPRPIKKVALQKGYGFSEHMAQNCGKTIVFYDSVQNCFDAVLSGAADAAYVNVYVANYLLAERRYAALTATSMSKYTTDICLGISRFADPRLFSILDKCIQHTSPERIDGLVLKNSSRPGEVTLRDFVEQHLVEVGLAILLVFGSILILLAYNLALKVRSNHRIQALLYKDALTQLDNMPRFLMRCGELLKGGRDESYALLYGDIDQFKTINDNLGFAVGDKVLQAFGSVLQRNVGDRECCARSSADQFLLLLQYDHWDSLRGRMEGMVEELDRWRREQSMPYRIDTVFGVYPVNAKEGLDVHHMLDLANYARRNAKQTARRFVLYDAKMREEILLQRELEGRLEIALKEGEFEAYYQPKVDMRNGRIVGCEALVRWNHPSRGLLMPGSFIPYFERNGSVMEIDLVVYEQTCRAIRTWIDKGLPAIPVSCNFSALHFDRPDFIQGIESIAQRFHIPHQRLEIEITESAIMRNPQMVSAQILTLKEHGFLVTIDDFGSGYSSLGLLQAIMADVLKLDRSFVQRGLFGERERLVIGSVVRMAKQLGMDVLCEGVESADQAAMLIALGCHRAQGFFYSRPIPLTEFEALLEEGFIVPRASA